MSKITFDIRKYQRYPLNGKMKGKEQLAVTYDRFNLMMSVIADIPFKKLSMMKVSSLYDFSKRNTQEQKQPKLKGHLAVMVKELGELAKVSGDRNVAQLFVMRRQEAQSIARAIGKLQKFGLLSPGLSSDPRQQYFRKIVLGRAIQTIGHFTPRDMFDRPMEDLSELERSVILEAKVVGWLDWLWPKLPPNNRCCKCDAESTLCRCKPVDEELKLTCNEGQAGKCAARSDMCPPDFDGGGETPPEVEPTPGGSDNP